MTITGADLAPGFQQSAFVDTETGDCGEQRLEHCGISIVLLVALVVALRGVILNQKCIDI